MEGGGAGIPGALVLHKQEGTSMGLQIFEWRAVDHQARQN